MNEKKPSLKTKETMNEYSVQVYNFTGALFGLYALCAVGFFLYPVMAFAIFHMSEPCLPIFIPGVDINTKKGYTVTSIYHYLVLLVATLGLAFIDALFLNLVFNMLTMSELQCNQLSKLNEEMDNAKEHATSIRFRLINFFKMHQEMERYTFLLIWLKRHYQLFDWFQIHRRDQRLLFPHDFRADYDNVLMYSAHSLHHYDRQSLSFSLLLLNWL